MGSMPPPTQEVVFCFAGQGYVPLEASRDLYRTCDVFRQSINEVAAAIKVFHETENEDATSISLPDYFMEAEERPAHTPKFTSETTNSELTPPSATMVIFSAQYALAKTIQSQGLKPTAIVGYSLGEHIASIVTGSLPLQTGVKLLLRRDILFSDRDLIPTMGGMVTVQAKPEDTVQALASHGMSGDVEISGYPHKKSTILSGESEALDEAQKALQISGIDTDRRAIQLGMHSSHVNRVATKLRSDPAIFCPEDSRDAKVVPGIDHWSCLGAKLKTGTPLNGKYWATQLVTPIHFKQCIEGIFRESEVQRSPDSTLLFLDLGMGPRLSRLIQNTLQDTPEWKEGRVKAISCIQPMGLDAEVKAKEGWAFLELKSRLLSK
jgi:acyl transferase domain-containing protein